MTIIALPVEDVKALLDIATNSMDFGSGFLDQEEVETMRRIAVQLGVDPIEVTPDGFRTQWAHVYVPVMKAQWEPWVWRNPRKRERLPDKELCDRCGLEGDDPIHHGVDNIAKAGE